MAQILIEESALDSLKRMVEELERDAARWRFSRDNHIQYFEPTKHWKMTDGNGKILFQGVACCYEDAIDAAMKHE